MQAELEAAIDAVRTRVGDDVPTGADIGTVGPAPDDADWRDEDAWRDANPGIAAGFCSIDELRINVKYLQEGMVLTRDVVDSGGFVLLARGNALTRHLIDQLAAVARHARRNMVAHVERGSVPKAEVTSPEEIPVEPDTG